MLVIGCVLLAVVVSWGWSSGGGSLVGVAWGVVTWLLGP